MARLSVYKNFHLSALLVLTSSLPAAAAQFQIKDSEGFGRTLVAKIANVPEGWRTQGRIAWNKPCSSNDLFETLFHTRAPDGSAGARIMPGYQFIKDFAQLTSGYAPDPMLNMMVAQSDAFNQQLATDFRGSNCGVAEVEGTETILRTLILNNRPSGAKVVRMRANEALQTAMRQNFGGALPGVRITFDAQIVELSYLFNGVQTTEWLYLSWYRFVQEPTDLGGVTVSSSHTIVEPLQFVYAPAAQAQNMLPRLDGIFAKMQTNPDWQKRVNELYRKLNAQREKERKEREAESDRRHREFIEMIAGSSVGGGSGGSVGASTPETVASETGSQPETDYWGEPVQETDFWGDPLPKKDIWGEVIEE